MTRGPRPTTPITPITRELPGATPTELAHAFRRPRMDVSVALPPGALGLRAYAKLNLHLEVLRQRPDRYHDIETVLQSIGLYDTLHLVPRPAGIGILCDDPGVPTDDSNLCLRAARALLEAANLAAPPRGVRIDLYKSIPVASGLGGGSADAAATLIGLDTFWELRLGPDRLHEIAASIGSDVPFCLRGGTALARGRGDRLQPLPPLRKAAFLLVFPGVAVSTAWAYEQLGMGLTRRPPALSMDHLKTILARYPDGARAFYNRLEDAVRPAHPVVSEVIARLLRSGASVALMSGSGSGVFGAFKNVSAAEQARRTMGRTDWRMPVVESRQGGVELFR